MRILLISPPYNRLKGKFRPNFPLGLGYIAAFLGKHGFAAAIYEADNMKPEELKRFGKSRGYSGDMAMHRRFVESFQDGFDYVWDEAKQIITDYSPHVVGISSITVTFRSALTIARICKQIDPSIFTVLGGAHPTVMPDETLREDSVDFVVQGEGEVTFLKLIEALCNDRKFEDIKGISYKKDGLIIHNPPRNLIEQNDLDNLPFPARHLLINSAGYCESMLNGLFSEIIVSRGCPFGCTFCASNNIWGRHWRTRSVDGVVEETKFLIGTYKVRHFYFFSDTINANRKWIMEFCEKIRDLGITWKCLGRVDTLDEKMVRAMKKAGCCEISLGIESGSDRVLKMVGKEITVAHVEDVARLMRRVGMAWGTFFMIGFPRESRDDIERTFELIKKLKPAWHKIAVPVPYPGTLLYHETKSLGILPEEINWNEFDGRSSRLFCVTNVSRDDFVKLRDEIFVYVDRYNMLKSFRMLAIKSLKLLCTNPLSFLKKTSYKFRGLLSRIQ